MSIRPVEPEPSNETVKLPVVHVGVAMMATGGGGMGVGVGGSGVGVGGAGVAEANGVDCGVAPGVVRGVGRGVGRDVLPGDGVAVGTASLEPGVEDASIAGSLVPGSLVWGSPRSCVGVLVSPRTACSGRGSQP